MSLSFISEYDGKEGRLKIYKHVESFKSGLGWIYTSKDKRTTISDPETQHKAYTDAMYAAQDHGIRVINPVPVG